ncbi:TIGR02117 family protein [Pseudophaeobacter sp. EL27]|uniref:TIGR02117 family protein n=1 Tax=Pseudophaeobacter sp. EL27 TaxID=2107580 RepID=UPI0020B14F3C|nr:TIGR02117 family protein [Pseudophaeobacter sp. EL27]
MPIGLITAYCLAAVLGAVIPSGSAKIPATARSHQVLLVAGPIHYDFLLPLDAQTRAQFGFLQASGLPVNHLNARWLVIGWGAHGFYTTERYQELTPSTLLKATFGDRSVMRAEVLGHQANLPDLPSLQFDDAEYEAFLLAIADSFERPERAPVRSLDVPGFTPGDRFYAAKGQFHLFRTCNTWVSRMIRASGRRFGIWTPLPYSVSLSQWLYLKE